MKKVLLKKKKIKKQNMVVKDIKIYPKLKSKGQLNIDKTL